jgi:hypothetical protein
MSARTYLGFLPWLVFAFVGRTTGGGVAWGGVAALAIAVIIAVSSARTGSLTLLEVSAIVLFAGFAFAGAIDQHNPQGFLAEYFRALAAGGLALVAFASTRFTPLTEPYAREIVLRKFWDTARFKRVNVELTLMCGVTFLGIALSYAAAATVHSHALAITFNWIVPVGLALLGVRRATLRWSEEFDAAAMSLDAMLDQSDLWEYTE